MKSLTDIGRLLYAVAVTAFGVEHFVFGRILSALILIPENAPAYSMWVYLIGILFIGFGICIVLKIRTQLTATLLGILFLLLYAIFHLPREITNPFDPGAWTAAFELIGLAGGAFVVARIYKSQALNDSFNIYYKMSLFLFASTFVVVGIQHLLYGGFIATLIPSWIPFSVFWAYFVGIAFFATSLSLVTGIKVPLAMTLLGIMFLLWVLVLHGPRVAANPQTETEWTSLFIAMSMSGIAFMIAGSVPILYSRRKN